ncbi:carbohydrate kinase (thermoresistant glucokinase family) [Ancylobacter sp. 3268]|nr:carbohydrate kinase (thermoresistant glucokinase family) [Ancylobacter sp. 3268]
MDTAAEFIVVMGVSGAGKSEIAQRLAGALAAPFIEADRLHSAENVARMAQGIGLTDEMRWPWLAAVCAAARAEPQRPVIIACSALRRVYRDFLRRQLGDVGFVFLDGPRELIAERLRGRPAHFATTSLLESQLATLEPPTGEADTFAVSLTLAPAQIVDAVLRRVQPAEAPSR